MSLNDAPHLIAQIHLPPDHPTVFLYRRFGENVGALDGSTFAFARAKEILNAYGWWETSEPVGLGRGQTLEILDIELSAQIVQPILENPP
ncbi:hypothetical protein [Deinococcus radiopugnans]|uniref:Uncharacterized protein n=1 Tax=Deinococcus radiopugnans ATCC 19172 TaxID=585398 RepID=A0A5C4XLA6_9DEIO|nr:hypothetical protein [Deinococcus radiopugnans]MBB6018810.1 hypothetical protein [Deinococcus radiopugnans ATCC 19172]TNM64212.1 hypothetical protein FHR04_20035 [Deinococcus radiopugnans ATCC 19172]